MLVCKGKDNAPRWREGERLQHLFEQRCDELHAAGGNVEAVATQNATYTFRDLDDRANQVARHLIARGVRAGDRIGLVFDKSFETYVALLAVLKANAAYVPLDPGFPNDRIGFILEDAGARFLLSMSAYAEKLAEFPVARVLLDSDTAAINAQPADRLSAAEIGAPSDQLAYIIYTSGTTGKPKGVAIDHPSICNFVRVAAEEYGMTRDDRCYQGMTIAFDFSVEELWVPLMAGATLVPARPGATLVGDDLADFLIEERISVWACVPTLLATIEKDLPDLRVLLLSGEACPPNLVTRWHRPGRSILNVYGPTEATVTATMREVTPDKPVTIGGPLPTYTTVILNPDKDELAAEGELGELGIAGIGLASGYLNRPELTEQKFIPDFLGIPHNPSGRIYRTGDLARIDASGEIEFHGRIDTQVKIRGYRIELTEIESLLMELPEIAQAVVDKYEPEPGAVELVAYYSLNHDAEDLDPSAIRDSLKGRLPCYMIPAYFEKLAVIPMTTSNKADRKNLPAPKGGRLSGANDNYLAPRTEVEEVLTTVLAEALKVERVSVADDFFKDLGAHSLLMARFCSEIRKRPQLPDISMRDVYMNPTVAKLAEHIEALDNVSLLPSPAEPVRIPSNLEYYGTGALQATFMVGYGLLGLTLLVAGVRWSYAVVDDLGALYLRILALALAGFAFFSAAPVAAKWLLIGRWKPQTIPIWSLRYFRFWLVKAMVGTSPMAAFAGSPIYNVYLRLLGAKIGRGAVILGSVPVTTDLISIGDNTILRRDSLLTGYRAQGNNIRIGEISIGTNAFVGEASVVDINTVMENDTQLGHASSLQSGQRIPLGKRFHGSPAVETSADYCQVESRDCSTMRRWVYTLAQAVPAALLAPLAIALLFKGFPYFYELTGSAKVRVTDPGAPFVKLALEMAALTFGLMLVGLALGLVGVAVVPRIFNRFLEEGKTYRLYGIHHFIFGLVSGASNSRFYNLVFGDSSAIVHYLRWIGWELNAIVQSGSNFGTNQRHDNPFLSEIGSGTMVSDGLSMMNAQMSSTSFRLCRTKIGDRNYLGNNIHYPSDGKTGANVLLGTKVMIPIDGAVRENVGLLGSPCFEIPRAVDRDVELGTAMDERTRRMRLHKKNMHNFVTISLYLLSNWLIGYVGLLGLYMAALAYPKFGMLSLAAFGVTMLPLGIAWFVLTERASLGFKPLTPKTVPVLDEYFWAHERHWKFCESPLQGMLNGTPFKNVISRLLGVKVGRKVFDDGAQFLEKTLITVGDHANLNRGVTIQGHSLEEGVFKSDYIKVGNGCSIGANAFVHYGVSMGDNVVLDPDSFLMKGEMPETDTTWQGNPAKAVHRAARTSAHAPASSGRALEQAA